MYLKVFVTPVSRKERVEEKGYVLAISVKEPAAGDRANDRVRELGAFRLGGPTSAVRILTGTHSRWQMRSVNG